VLSIAVCCSYPLYNQSYKPIHNCSSPVATVTNDWFKQETVTQFPLALASNGGVPEATCRAKVLYDYFATNVTELSLVEDEVLFC